LPQTPFDFTIEAPSRTQVPRSVEELRFHLSDIQIEGAETLPAESFRPLYASLIDHEVQVTDIIDVADAIERAYRAKGYVLAHAFVPAQRVRNGVFTIEVIEGYVASIAVEGGDTATQDRIRSFLAPVLASRPLTLATVERALLLANDLPGVTVAGILRPSPNVTGASELAATITETRFTGGAAVDNRGSSFSGFWTLSGDLEANGLATVGDQLAVSYATSPDALEKTSGQARYRRPLGNNGMTATFNVTVTHGEPGSTLQQANLVTDSYAVGPRLSYPILRSRDASVQLEGGFTVQNAHVRGLVAPSHDQWRVLDVAASYSGTALGGVWSASLDAAEGLGIAGATPDGSPGASLMGDAEFTKLSANFHHTRTLVGPLSLAVSGQGQYAFAPLLAGEQIAFGGTQIGRGYDPAAVTGDRGAGGSIELRWDEHVPSLRLETVEPYLYYDTGKVWNVRPGTGTTQSFNSAGLGIRVVLPFNITGDIELSRTLRAVPGSDGGRKATKILGDAAIRF